MPGLNETCEVRLRTAGGAEAIGFPDREASSRGQIVLVARTESGFEQLGPFRIDEITSAELTEDSARRDEPQARPTTILPPETPPDVRI